MLRIPRWNSSCWSWRRRPWLRVRAAAVAVAALGVPAGRAAAQSSASEVHTVRSGDTLWDLARHYLGDPFLWPAIFRLNTAVVEDPHWIYPGERLRLRGGEEISAVPASDTPDGPVQLASQRDSTGAPDEGPGEPAARGWPAADGDTAGPPPLFPAAQPRSAAEVLRAYTEQVYRPLRASEFYSSGFLTEGERLPFGRLLGPVTPQQIRSTSTRANATLFAAVAVEAPAGGAYSRGDTLLIVELGREQEGFGEAVVPTGLARVTEVLDGRYLATVVAVYGQIRKGQRTLPAERFSPGVDRRAVPVADGVRGSLLGGPGRRELEAPQMVLFVDRGRRDGVAPGDLFEVRRRAERRSDGTVRVDELIATLQVVHVRERSATTRVLSVVSPDIPHDAWVRQVAKLPS